MDSSKAEADWTIKSDMDSPLLQLPTELLLSIFKLLPSSVKHLFALSCRRLHFMFADLCPDLNLNSKNLVRRELARDGFSFRYCAYCNGCRSVHTLKFFSPEQLEQPPARRLCSASTKQIWAEPGKNYSFEDFQGTKRRLIPNAIPNKLPGTNCATIMYLFLESRVWMHTDPRETMWSNSLEQYAICASYDVLALPDAKEATKLEMSRILQGFDIPTCPHTRLGDTIVSKSYVPSRHCVLESTENLAVWIGKIETKGQHARCQFPGCKTVFRWSCTPSPKREGWKTVSIHIKRYLGTLLSPVNPTWMAQAAIIPNEARLEAYWNTCHEWKGVNMAIEEQRYERELQSQHGLLRKADEIEFGQLRRENDFLRHPHRSERYPRQVLGYPSELLDAKQPSDELPATTLLLKETGNGELKQVHSAPHVSNDSPDKSIPSHSKHAHDANKTVWTLRPDEELFTAQFTAEDVLKSIDNHARFDRLFDDHRAIAPWGRGIERFIWGGSDCLTYGNGLFGMMGVPYYVLAPKIRWLSNQLYRLPRSVKRRILKYDETENRVTY
ncbi:hypothetical protein BJY01DRAFT_216522 [Aspergillus pseudoustus]|uniref:F-box domain-containing protein n=1 Tax=Aspergillus pseudoustus TaxID=1810923 RepID=A0ABR4JQU8_9EURO